jgi:DNA repair and recombination protein RAD52
MPDEFAVDVRLVTTVNCNFPQTRSQYFGPSSAEIETPSKPGPDQHTKLQNRPRNGATIQPRRNTPSPTKQLARPPIQRPNEPPPMAAPPRPALGAPGPQFGQGARAQPQTINRPPPPKSNNRPGSNIQQSGPLRPQTGNLPNPQAAQNQRAAPNPQTKQGQPNTESCDQHTVPTMKAPQIQGRLETPPNLQIPHNPPVGFFTGRAALNLDGENSMIPDQAPVFNPHRPTTLPRSSGIDHTKSSPIPRKHIQGQVGAAALSPPNFQNPSLAVNRQIGAPPQRNAFRAPGMAGTKRAAESNPAPNG